jgi:hypothetical protein
VVVVVVDTTVGGVAVVVEVVVGRAPVPLAGVAVVVVGVATDEVDSPVPFPSSGSAAGAADAPVGDAAPDSAGVTPPVALFGPVWVITGRDGVTT